MISLIVGAAIGGVSGYVAHSWLDTRAYRYPDEAAYPHRTTGWVPWTMSFVLALIGYGWSDTPVLAAILGSYAVVLIVLSAIDLDVHRLPDVITLPLIVVTGCVLVIYALTLGDSGTLLTSLYGCGALGGFYFLQVILAKGRGMGLGDVKLALSLGAVLATLSWTHLITATVLTYLSAVVVALYLIIVTKAGRSTSIAFGPHMAIGALLVVIAPGATRLLILGHSLL